MLFTLSLNFVKGKPGPFSQRASVILLLCVPEPTDNASVNFVKYKGDYYVSTETNFMHRVDPENLDTLEKVLVHWNFYINDYYKLLYMYNF